MFPLFTKSLNQLAWTDVEELVSAGATENQAIEFKVDLHVDGGGRHPWHSGDRKIDPHARDDILKEIVAFANADGGNLVLGMAESKDHEKRATKPKPLPRCKELADRLRQLSESWIEPHVIGIEWRGITEGEPGDDGIVLARVPSSRLAPHRLEKSKEFYVRRGESAVPMTIREIRDAVLRSASMFDHVQRRLDGRAAALNELLHMFPDDEERPDDWAMRITVLPTSAPLFIDRPYAKHALFPTLSEFEATESGRKISLNLGPTGRSLGSRPASPILCGGRREQWLENRNTVVRQEVHADGMLEFMTRVDPSRGSGGARVSAGLVLGFAANALKIADTIRDTAGAPSAELVIDIQIQTAVDGGYLSWFPTSRDEDDISHFHTNPVHLPRYTVVGLETFPDVITRLMNSLRESARLPAIDDFSIRLD